MLTYHEKYINWHKNLSDQDKTASLATLIPQFLDYLKIKGAHLEIVANTFAVQFFLAQESHALKVQISQLHQEISMLKPSPVSAE